MPHDNLGDLPIEEVLNQVQGLAAVASQAQVQSVGALGARLTIEVSRALLELSRNVFTAKKQLVERMDSLTAEIKTASDSMNRAAVESSKQTAAMVKWTRTLVIVTAVYTLITGGLLWATIVSR